MSASALGARQRDQVLKRVRRGAVPGVLKSRMVTLGAEVRADAEPIQFSAVNLGDSSRVSLMLTSHGRGGIEEQAREVLDALEGVLQRQPRPMTVASQTVFLRDVQDRSCCAEIFRRHYGSKLPATNFVYQPPCCGAALALEAWAIGGTDVRVEYFPPHSLAVSYDGVRWVYCAGIEATESATGVYAQTTQALRQMREALVYAGTSFDQVVRTWLYIGGITEAERDTERYKELNRARTDFYRDIHFCRAHTGLRSGRIYPASTGIGMTGAGLVVGSLSFQSQRPDALLVPLENPRQTPAYAYHPRYSPQSPKFSRAMALVLGHYVTTWVSGTASIVNSESRHPDDAEKQTHQTIDNIERLIAAENFAARGVTGAGATLRDLAKIRVYLKRPGDFARCKAVCDRRFGPVPAVFAVADVCRPELLVEIEGTAFSPRQLDSSEASAAAAESSEAAAAG